VFDKLLQSRYTSLARIMANFFMTGKNMRTFIRLLCITLLMFSLSDCASYDFSKRNVQQGNLLPDEKTKQLKPGMSKEDVAILMGTSLMSPMFNNNRWDYTYTYRKGSGTDSVRKLSIYFSNNKLNHIIT
jgi:outer membrane protein assembly factor BamE